MKVLRRSEGFELIPKARSINVCYLIYFALIAFACIRLNEYIFDDAYIHFRIADNLLNEGLPYYNINEPFKSSSSTIWTLFLGLIKGLTGQEYVTVLPYVNATLLVSSCRIWQVCVENILKRRLTLFEFLVFALGYASICITNAIGMMEAILSVFILSLSGYFFVRNRSQLGFAFLAIGVFCRLEFVIFYFCVSMYNFICISKLKTFKYVLTSLIIALPLILFDLKYYGSIYPLAATAKSIVYALSLKSVIFGVIPHFSWGGKTTIVLSSVLSILSLIVLLWHELAGLRAKKMLNVIQIFGISSLLLLAAYVYKLSFVFPWYKPLYLVPSFVWLFLIAFQSAKRVNLIALAWLVFVSGFVSFCLTFFACFSGMIQYYPQFNNSSRVRRYLETGSAINKHYPGAVLMTSEIGGLGYSYNGYIKDGMGLIQPDCLRYHPMEVPDKRSGGAIGAIPTECVDEFRPEIIISYDVFIEHFSQSNIALFYNLYKYPVFTKADIKISMKDKNKIFGSEWLNVYIRKDIDKKLPLTID